jgi:hypothetical protein
MAPTLLVASSQSGFLLISFHTEEGCDISSETSDTYQRAVERYGTDDYASELQQPRTAENMSNPLLCELGHFGLTARTCVTVRLTTSLCSRAKHPNALVARRIALKC